MQPPPIENDRAAAPSHSEQPKRSWYRFTLRKVVVGFVLLSVLFAYLRYTHWGYVATEAVTKMGRSVGLVDPPDTSKIQVTAVRPFGTLDYEWRISIPAGEKYVICHSTGQIPSDDFPPAHGQPLPNEALVSYYLTSGNAEGYIRHGLGCSIHSCDGLVPVYRSAGQSLGKNLAWVYGQLKTTGILPENGTQSFAPGERIVLIRSVTTQRKGSWGIWSNRGDGILIWLEPAP
ncbi:hypothetical protein [Bremerella cremea]|nr:hypothetical protein [Bremerella cremea]